MLPCEARDFRLLFLKVCWVPTLVPDWMVGILKLFDCRPEESGIVICLDSTSLLEREGVADPLSDFSFKFLRAL